MSANSWGNIAKAVELNVREYTEWKNLKKYVCLTATKSWVAVGHLCRLRSRLCKDSLQKSKSVTKKHLQLANCVT